jgi:hypothetical protein
MPFLPWIAVAAVLGVIALASKKPAVPPPDPDVALVTWVRNWYVNVARVLQLQAPPLVFSSAVPNAASNGAAILVNIAWVRETLQKHCEDEPCGVAVIVGLLVHELTHHVYQDAQVPPSNWPERRLRERRADFNAGFALASLGMDASHLERVLGDPALCCDLLHDPPPARVQAIREGARRAALRAA